jgi:polysaccharide biosynthesis/export protein
MNSLRILILSRRTSTGAVALWAMGMFMGAWMLSACGTTGEVVQVTHVSAQQDYNGLGEKDLARLEEIKKARENKKADLELKNVIQSTPNYSVMEYLSKYPASGDTSTQDYRVGGYDVLDIVVYEEQDLSRTNVPVSADGHISFPLIGRVHVDNLTTSQIETQISDLLAKGQFVLDAHVSVTVTDYKSRQFMVLGSVKLPGTYPLKAKERVLDAVSRAGGVDFEQGGNQAVVIRTLTQGAGHEEEKIVIRIDLPGLLKGGDQVSNLLLAGNDLLYIPKAENFFIIGQVNKPGSYPYLEKQITLVEAISKAGGFTQIAARNRTRIIRMVNGEEQIIKVQVDAITDAGKKGQDIGVLPGDVIVVPESFF